ncbi:MAG: hypothetical protein AMXMBFR81_00830 [Chthonomonas sp.]
MVMTDRTIAVADLKANFAQTLREAIGGEPVTVVKHGTPLARLSGLEASGSLVAEPRARYDGGNGSKGLDQNGVYGHNRIMSEPKISIADAKANLSKYVKIAASGQVVVICNRNVPVAELRPIPRETPRNLGVFAGAFELSDAFFEPLVEEEAAGWEDEPDEPAA